MPWWGWALITWVLLALFIVRFVGWASRFDDDEEGPR